MSQTTEAAKAMVREKWKWLNKNILGEQSDHHDAVAVSKDSLHMCIETAPFFFRILGFLLC